MLKKK